MKRKEIEITADPEDYIEACHIHEINSDYHRVGFECYTNNEDQFISVNDIRWNKQKANKRAHRAANKSECCFGETDPIGKLVSMYVHYED